MNCNGKGGRMASEYGYVIVKVIKGFSGRATSDLVDVVGIATTKDMAIQIADEKSKKSYNYTYLIKKVRRY